MASWTIDGDKVIKINLELNGESYRVALQNARGYYPNYYVSVVDDRGRMLMTSDQTITTVLETALPILARITAIDFEPDDRAYWLGILHDAIRLQRHFGRTRQDGYLAVGIIAPSLSAEPTQEQASTKKTSLEMILAHFFSPDTLQFMLGDLNEEYSEILERRGRLAADSYYLTQILKSVLFKIFRG